MATARAVHACVLPNGPLTFSREVAPTSTGDSRWAHRCSPLLLSLVLTPWQIQAYPRARTHWAGNAGTPNTPPAPSSLEQVDSSAPTST